MIIEELQTTDELMDKNYTSSQPITGSELLIQSREELKKQELISVLVELIKNYARKKQQN